MKIKALALLLSFSLLCNYLFSQNQKKIMVKIKCLHQSAFCGGAMISPEMLKNGEQTVPFKTLYIKKGEKNNVKSKVFKTVKTDSLGQAKFSLPPGTYYVIDMSTIDSTEYLRLKDKYKSPSQFYDAIDINCLNAWIETPLLVLKVNAKGKQEYISTTYGRCEYSPLCVNYTGPPPP
jgi:hypothetical protein